MSEKNWQSALESAVQKCVAENPDHAREPMGMMNYGDSALILARWQPAPTAASNALPQAVGSTRLT
ncbi:hypothetical protein NMG46_14220 [Mesorhizobium sp. LMG 17147]|uniref:hypothetical protein n=1 Tax=Mesorhizobium sp. LMG 17147 TaxID=2963091 RepID=UPI0020C94F72|nr:hypothetical protein [Mesorhizobium sp. LMG 17147]MCP9231400.1 hypothetical protein [Mesorhizobium sp. LMG 17147]